MPVATPVGGGALTREDGGRGRTFMDHDATSGGARAVAPDPEPRASPASAAGAVAEPARRRHLVQVLLPLRDNAGRPFAEADLAAVRAELAGRFGGLTAHSRAPAEGVWRSAARGATDRDDVVVLEVMADRLDRGWWGAYRRDLERRFRQEAIVVRAHKIRML